MWMSVSNTLLQFDPRMHSWNKVLELPISRLKTLRLCVAWPDLHDLYVHWSYAVIRYVKNVHRKWCERTPHPHSSTITRWSWYSKYSESTICVILALCKLRMWIFPKPYMPWIPCARCTGRTHVCLFHIQPCNARIMNGQVDHHATMLIMIKLINIIIIITQTEG